MTEYELKTLISFRDTFQYLDDNSTNRFIVEVLYILVDKAIADHEKKLEMLKL